MGCAAEYIHSGDTDSASGHCCVRAVMPVAAVASRRIGVVLHTCMLAIMRCMSSSCLSTTLKAGPGLRERGSGGAACRQETGWEGRERA
jgi:hypothetical protein